MQKYLWCIKYKHEGLEGFLKEGGTTRRELLTGTLESLGGKLDSAYWSAAGPWDHYLIGEVPDMIAASTVIWKSTVGYGTDNGAGVGQVYPLHTPEECDELIKREMAYRAPGQPS